MIVEFYYYHSGFRFSELAEFDDGTCDDVIETALRDWLEEASKAGWQTVKQ